MVDFHVGSSVKAGFQSIKSGTFRRGDVHLVPAIGLDVVNFSAGNKYVEGFASFGLGALFHRDEEIGRTTRGKDDSDGKYSDKSNATFYIDTTIGAKTNLFKAFDLSKKFSLTVSVGYNFSNYRPLAGKNKYRSAPFEIYVGKQGCIDVPPEEADFKTEYLKDTSQLVHGIEAGLKFGVHSFELGVEAVFPVGVQTEDKVIEYGPRIMFSISGILYSTDNKK